jgi:hypothetical protein
MSDLTVCNPRSALDQEPRHRKPSQSAVPLDFESEISSKLQVYARSRRSSAAC